MKKLMVSMFALAAMASTAMAAEPLTTSQLDQVTAAGRVQFNISKIDQYASAYAASAAVCGLCGVNASAATATAANVALVSQEND